MIYKGDVECDLCEERIPAKDPEGWLRLEVKGFDWGGDNEPSPKPVDLCGDCVERVVKAAKKEG